MSMPESGTNLDRVGPANPLRRFGDIRRALEPLGDDAQLVPRPRVEFAIGVDESIEWRDTVLLARQVHHRDVDTLKQDGGSPNHGRLTRLDIRRGRPIGGAKQSPHHPPGLSTPPETPSQRENRLPKERRRR